MILSFEYPIPYGVITGYPKFDSIIGAFGKSISKFVITNSSINSLPSSSIPFTYNVTVLSSLFHSFSNTSLEVNVICCVYSFQFVVFLPILYCFKLLFKYFILIFTSVVFTFGGVIIICIFPILTPSSNVCHISPYIFCPLY